MNAEEENVQLKQRIAELEQRFQWSLLDHRRVLEDWSAQRIVLDAAVLQAAYLFQAIGENTEVPADIRALAAKGCERCDKAHEDAGDQPRPALSKDAAAKVVIRVEDSILERLALKKADKTRIAEMQKARGSEARPRYFGMEGAIREGWGKPTLRHAIGYLEQRYGSEEADAIALLKDRAATIPESPPDRPAPW